MDARTIEGQLISAAGRRLPERIPVWFAFRTVSDDARTVETFSDAQDRFAFELPEEPLQAAVVGAAIEGVAPVDLEPRGARLEAGTLVLVVDDLVPAHLRYGGLG